MQNDNFDTCPALDKELLDTSKISAPSPLPPSFVDLSASLEVIDGDIFTWQWRYYLHQ